MGLKHLNAVWGPAADGPLLGKLKEESVYDNSAHRSNCEICGHPASVLFSGGVLLCTTHAAEAHCLETAADTVEWSLTAAGLAALEAAPAAARPR